MFQLVGDCASHKAFDNCSLWSDMVGSAGSQEYMTSYQIATPKSFSYTDPEDWLKWIRMFEPSHQASGLATKSEARVRQE